jgi:SAM-dependent methyltransferase
VVPEACPACGGPLAPWRRAPAAEPPHAPVALRRCARCGTAVTVAPAGSHESGAYAPLTPRGARLAAPVLRAFDRRRLALLHRAIRPPGRLLDAGAGRGRFVATARAAGWDAEGVEPSARGVAAARAAYGVTLQHAAIEDAAIAPASLDAVTLWHVLEHVDDPGAALDRVAAWLRPGGVVLVGAPNLASVQARLGGERWFHLDLPRHRTHFTADGLLTLLARHGLDPVRTHHVLLEHNPFGLWASLVSQVTPTPSWLYLALKRAAPLRAAEALPTALAVPLAPLAAAAELAAGLARRGGTVAVLAIRRPSPRAS